VHSLSLDHSHTLFPVSDTFDLQKRHSRLPFLLLVRAPSVSFARSLTHPRAHLLSFPVSLSLKICMRLYEVGQTDLDSQRPLPPLVLARSLSLSLAHSPSLSRARALSLSTHTYIRCARQDKTERMQCCLLSPPPLPPLVLSFSPTHSHALSLHQIRNTDTANAMAQAAARAFAVGAPMMSDLPPSDAYIVSSLLHLFMRHVKDV